MRYVGLQIAQCREDTGETDYSDTNGIPQSVAIQAAREAIIHCQNVLYLAAPQIFDNILEISGVANEDEYSLPGNTYLGSGIAAVEYSADGTNENYYRLELSDYAYRLGGSGSPVRFIPYSERSLLIDPAPGDSSGKIRVAYSAHLDTPDIRRGKVASVTNDGTDYTTIVLESDATLDETNLALNEYLCVNDKDGNVEYYNLYYTAYDSATKTITLGDGALLTGGTISVGDYITLDRYSTTHIKLDPIAEPIILAYIRRRFYLNKSSTDVKNEEDNIAAFTKEMVGVYKRRIRTQKKVPYTGKFENIFRGTL